MKKLIISLLFVFVSGCNTVPKAQKDQARYFSEKNGCFLLYNVKTKTFDKVIGEENCKVQYPACSSFKVPLAAMGFDAGILKNENTLLKWNGKVDPRPVVNKDHTAQSWMTDSVVWYSQVITKKMGTKKFQKYLNDFKYGNKDISGGLTEAWLHAPDSSSPALKISAYEQVDFMKKLWSNELPVTAQATELTKKITFLETSPKGFALHGKTGSNFFKAHPKQRLGWFIAHLQKGDQEYIAVTNFTDKSTPNEEGYGGFKSKEITKKILADSGLW